MFKHMLQPRFLHLKSRIFRFLDTLVHTIDYQGNRIARKLTVVLVFACTLFLLLKRGSYLSLYCIYDNGGN